MSRATECTPAAVDAICAAYAKAPQYTPFADVLAQAGVAKRTYYGWRERAEQGEAPFLEAVARVEAARRSHLAPLVATIALLAESGTKADATKLRASTWLLERLGGEAWNPPSRAEVSGPDGKPIPVAATVDAGALLAKINDLATRRAARGAEPGRPGGDPGGADGG